MKESMVSPAIAKALNKTDQALQTVANNSNKKIETLIGQANTFEEAYALSPGSYSITAIQVKVGATDAPASTGAWTVIQSGYQEYGWQLALQTNSNRIFFRRKFKTWQVWQELALKSEIAGKVPHKYTGTATTGDSGYISVSIQGHAATPENFVSIVPVNNTGGYMLVPWTQNGVVYANLTNRSGEIQPNTQISFTFCILE